MLTAEAPWRISPPVPHPRNRLFRIATRCTGPDSHQGVSAPHWIAVLVAPSKRLLSISTSRLLTRNERARWLKIRLPTSSTRGNRATGVR